MTHMCCDTTAREAVHRGFNVEFLSDATGTLPLSNSAGQATAEELHRSILCAQQMLLSEVLPSSEWINRLWQAFAWNSTYRRFVHQIVYVPLQSLWRLGMGLLTCSCW